MDFSNQTHEWRKEFRPACWQQIKPKLDLGPIFVPFQNIAILENDRTQPSLHCQLTIQFVFDDFISHSNFQQSEIAQQTLGCRADFAKRTWRSLSQLGHIGNEAGMTLSRIQESKHIFEGLMNKNG